MKTKKQLIREIEELTEHNQKLVDRNNALCEEVHKLREGDRICDEYCTGCVHLIEMDEPYIPDGSYCAYSIKKRLCKFNRRCKSFVEKGDSKDES